MTEPIVFALAVLALLGVPGPTNTLLAAGGATRGVRQALPLLIGELLGYNIAITVYRLTLGTLFSEAGTAQLVLKIVVAGYLLWLAIRLWRSAQTDARSAVTIRSLFVTTLLNPKALIFALLIFPAAPTPILYYQLAFSGMVVSVGACWIVAGSLTTRLLRPQHRFIPPRICAVALAVFAFLLVAGSFSR